MNVVPLASLSYWHRGPRTTHRAWRSSQQIAALVMRRGGFGGLHVRFALLLLPVAERGFDRIFGQHRELNLDGGQRQFADDVLVLDGQRFLDRLALHPFGGQGRTRNRRTATEGLKLRLFESARLRIYLHLQL